MRRWGLWIGGLAAVALIAYCAWLVYSDAPVYRFLVRLYVDKKFLKSTLKQWGFLAPLLFMALQALQVVFSPIPGEATGFLGGYLFGEWLGLLDSTIGLTVGSVAAFGIGRWLGERYVRNLVSKETWGKLGFIVEAEGAILCFILYLIPGLPKDIVCYLFGISPMPLWVFARGLWPRPHSGHLGAVRPGRARRDGQLLPRDPDHRGVRGDRASALLLPSSDHDLAARQGRAPGARPAVPGKA